MLRAWEVRRCRHGSRPPVASTAWGVLPPAWWVRRPLMGTCDRSLVRKVDDGERISDGLPAGHGSSERRAEVATPDEVNVWVGLDVGKEEHFADVLDADGNGLFAMSIGNEEAALVALLERASNHGSAGLVIDQPGS